MTGDLERRLSELRDHAPEEAPAELLSAARAEAGELRSRRRRALRTRAALVAVAGIALVGASLTPPGRAATGWIADVAGIGEEPTLPQEGSVQGSAVVLASSTLSDGTPYEIVVKLINTQSWIEAAADSRSEAEELLNRPGFGIPESVCFQVDWPGEQDKGQGGLCTRTHRTGDGNEPVLETTGLIGPPSDYRNAGLPAVIHYEGPKVLMGVADSTEVAEVRVLQIDRDGNEVELPSQLLTVDGELLERIGGKYPVSVFAAALDDDVVEAGDSRQAQVTAIAYDADGTELGRTDAFPPLDCPEDPSTLIPEAPPIPEPPHPATEEERAIMQRAQECGVVPTAPSKVAMEQGELDREPLPATVQADAADLGVAVAPATQDELTSVFADDFAGSTALDAMRPSPYEPPEANMGYQGPVRIYLARDTNSDRLVYVVHRTVNAVILPDGSRDREADGLPREYLSIIDVASGDRVAERELE